jgi:AraC-like DNA-binding protein
MASQNDINPFLVKGQESLPGDSVELFSELSGVSARQLRRLYKSRFGISTKTYLRILRFLKAKELLMMPATKELAEIAAECQYADQAHLIKEFHRFTGFTPTSFRNRYLMSGFYNTARR